jgi:hypothetical protein
MPCHATGARVLARIGLQQRVESAQISREAPPLRQSSEAVLPPHLVGTGCCRLRGQAFSSVASVSQRCAKAVFFSFHRVFPSFFGCILGNCIGRMSPGIVRRPGRCRSRRPPHFAHQPDDGEGVWGQAVRLSPDFAQVVRATVECAGMSIFRLDADVCFSFNVQARRIAAMRGNEGIGSLRSGRP